MHASFSCYAWISFLAMHDIFLLLCMTFFSCNAWLLSRDTWLPSLATHDPFCYYAWILSMMHAFLLLQCIDFFAAMHDFLLFLCNDSLCHDEWHAMHEFFLLLCMIPFHAWIYFLTMHDIFLLLCIFFSCNTLLLFPRDAWHFLPAMHDLLILLCMIPFLSMKSFPFPWCMKYLSRDAWIFSLSMHEFFLLISSLVPNEDSAYSSNMVIF